ncbi:MULTISPECIES: hypothetical protein [unclassified Geodermatophilus]|uniref:hypothetical protein n=1 Tax=unclassified Geodermatophilus TaxID=2637632 RepID=UPI003EEE1BDC
MSESGSSSLGANEEIDDPGRDPKGLNPPRNPLSGGLGSTTGGPDQDSGRGEPEGSPGTVGESMVPESPEESANTTNGGARD